MKPFIFMLIVVGSCFCGCHTPAPSAEQTSYADQLSELITIRDAWASRGYEHGRAALRALLQDKTPHWELTLMSGVDWTRYSVPELKELMKEVSEQIRLVQADLTTHPDRKTDRNANNELQPTK